MFSLVKSDKFFIKYIPPVNKYYLKSLDIERNVKYVNWCIHQKNYIFPNLQYILWKKSFFGAVIYN